MVEQIVLNAERVDQSGALWMRFDVDYLAQQVDGECTICGATLTDGWLCLDGADEVCSAHVVLP